MNIAALKRRLHEYIEQADNEHIAAMYILLGKDIAPDSAYDEATLKLLYERVTNDEKNNSSSYSAAETFDYVRSQKASR